MTLFEFLPFQELYYCVVKVTREGIGVADNFYGGLCFQRGKKTFATPDGNMMRLHEVCRF